MNKKKLFAIAIAVCLIAILSFSTLAWFTDSDEAVNEFYITNSDATDPDDVFSIDVWENVEGEEEPVDNATFQDILPGQTVEKQPYVENTGAYDQWVRVTVSFSNAAAWEAALGDSLNYLSMLNGLNTDEWDYAGSSVNAEGEAELVFYLKDRLAPGETARLFDSITVPAALTQQHMVELFQGGFSLSVYAEAIQADHTGDSAVEAFQLID